MPKQKITREMVVEAAFSLAREGGMGRVLVKPIAQRLGCSVQPIYSTCGDMEGVRQAVAARADRFIRDYVARPISAWPERSRASSPSSSPGNVRRSPLWTTSTARRPPLPWQRPLPPT